MKKGISVYYDGLCHLCSREINHYRGMRGAEGIRFVDITSAAFDAFLCIWRELPSLRFLVPIARWAPVYFLLRMAYAGFARIRPFLPRKSCEDSPYCEIKREP